MLHRRRDPLGEREPLGDEGGLDLGDDRPEVEGHGVALRGDELALVTLEQRHDLRVCRPVDLVPHLRELVAGDDLRHLVVHESVDAVQKGDLEARDRRRHPGGHAVLLGQGVQRHPGDPLEVEVVQHRLRDLVGQRGLDARVVDERVHGLDVLVGVGDDPVGPHRGDRERGEHAGQDHQDPRDDAEAAHVAVLRLGRGRRTCRRELGLQLGDPGPEGSTSWVSLTCRPPPLGGTRQRHCPTALRPRASCRGDEMDPPAIGPDGSCLRSLIARTRRS